MRGTLSQHRPVDVHGAPEAVEPLQDSDDDDARQGALTVIVTLAIFSTAV